MAAARTHYQVLGVSESATAEQVRAAYRRLAKQHHPDASSAAGAQQRFAAIAAAYEVLSDPSRRRAYDRAIERARGGGGAVDGNGGVRPGPAHYTWTNIATGRAPAAGEPTELDELYDTFFTPPKPRRAAPKPRRSKGS